MERYLAGVDVGTTGAKVILFDLEGHPVSQAYQEYGCTYPAPGWVEQDCAMLIQAVYACCRQVAEQVALGEGQLAGVSVSAQRSCTVFLDREGSPLRMVSWLDGRAGAQAEEIGDAVGREKFYQLTGLPLSGTWILPKLLHMRRHDPELWAKTARVAQLQDVILVALGAGELISDEPEAGFYGLWDGKKFAFSQELLDAFGLDRELFPQVRQSGSLAGRMTAQAAKSTGFPEGTPICVGIGDQNSAALGAGLVRPGMVSVSLGTGGLATALLDTFYRDPAGQAMVTHHAIHGLYTFEGLQNAAAGAFRWFRDELAAQERLDASAQGVSPYDLLDEKIDNIAPGAQGLLMLPWFAGSAAPRWNPGTKGGFLGLTLAHTRAHMARACVEGITLEQKDILQSLVKSGARCESVRIVGGATKSHVWNQLQADVYGLPCETLEVPDAAALGAALCAGVGTGVFSSFEEGVSRMVRVAKRYEPNPARTAVYEKLYGVYCDAYQALSQSKVFEKLEELTKKEA